MEEFDAVVVGAGPGGSSCAWALGRLGLRVAVLDRKRFPRDKVCAGWVTPPVFESLEIEPEHYAKERVLQPIRGFRVARLGDRWAEVEYPETVSFGIRRCELDAYLLSRSGATCLLGEPLRTLERRGEQWVVNGRLRAPSLVGAGGHFCPVARWLGARPGGREPTIVAREIEFEMSAAQEARCSVRPDLPELYFTRDLRGYGWAVRKGAWLNVGIGRQDPERFPARVEAFVRWLGRAGRIPADLPHGLRGHAYLLYDQSPRPLAADGVLLVGDAAGMAYGRSGEGIRPAVEAGLIAATVIATANGRIDRAAARRYEEALAERFGRRFGRARRGPSDWIPAPWRGPAAGWLLGSSAFARHVVIDRWFLHRHAPPLPPPGCGAPPT